MQPCNLGLQEKACSSTTMGANKPETVWFEGACNDTSKSKRISQDEGLALGIGGVNGYCWLRVGGGVVGKVRNH